MKWLRRLLAGGLLVGLLYGGWLLVDGNAELVRIDYLVGEVVDVALWRALVAAFAAGAVAALAVMGLGLIRARLETREYRKALAGHETEVHQLRNLPLVSETGGSGGQSKMGTGSFTKDRSA
jgi:hypothetical protein